MTPLTFWLNAFALWKIKPNSVYVCVSSACLCAELHVFIAAPVKVSRDFLRVKGSRVTNGGESLLFV